MSRPFYELPADVRQIICRIANYDSFDKNGYHDACVLILDACSVCWRIEHREEGLVLDVSLGGDT
jgi:hypothetical protein